MTPFRAERLESFPEFPEPFQVPDWRRISHEYADLVFDHNATGPHMPLVWLDKNHVNDPEDTFGHYVTVADPRGGPEQANGAYHDSVGDMGAVLCSTIAGIDMRDYKGQNWVRMCRGFFNRANGRNVFMEFTREFDPAKTGGGYNRDFWYDVLPSLIAIEIGMLYPDEASLAEPLRVTADQFAKAARILLETPEGFAWSSFDWQTMEPIRNFIPPQQDAAAAFASLLLLAHKWWGVQEHLDRALACLDWLDAQQENPLYDALASDAVYAMAFCNAKHGTGYDVEKALNWCFGGGFKCVEGVHAGTWGDYDVSGLAEMRLVDRLYALETFKLAKSLLPACKYEPRLAAPVGKWMLHAANNMRLFYPDYLPPENQMAWEFRDLTRGVIGYECVTKRSMHRSEHPIPFAERDDWKNHFTPSGEPAIWPPAGHFSLYGSSWVGLFGGLVERTQHEMVLKLDCSKTDLCGKPAEPCHLYFNPYRQEITVEGTEVAPKQATLIH